MCACVRASVRASVRLCVRACVRASVRASVHPCVRMQGAASPGTDVREGRQSNANG